MVKVSLAEIGTSGLEVQVLFKFNTYYKKYGLIIEGLILLGSAIGGETFCADFYT